MSRTSILTGNAKRKEVARLLRVLEDGQGRAGKDERDLVGVLAQLKVYGRDPEDAEPLYCKNGVSILATHAFEGATVTSREALRCIANALLLAPILRQDFIDLDLLHKAAARMKSIDYDDEFLVSRIILLMTYGTNLNQDKLLRDLSVASSINAHLIQHAETCEASGSRSPSDGIGGMAVMALSETLKLLFNLSVRQNNAILFQPAIKPIISILHHVELPPRCLDPPVGVLINALVNLDLVHAENPGQINDSPPSPFDLHTLVDDLIAVLGQSLDSYKETELERSLPPLLTVLHNSYGLGGKDLRAKMQDALLPVNEDRNMPLGKSSTLPSRLLRLSSSALAPNLREIIPALTFALSDQDPKKFIENIGYGFAAGFLASHQIAVPENVGRVQQEAGNGTNRSPVNPITGQRLDKEPEDTAPPMTTEEKEREAERLFVLFERLKATGVVDVQNPVHQAMNGHRSGSRIEEVDDSD